MSRLHGHLPNRKILSLSGPDTITLLERLVTNHTSNWGPGEARYGALLTPQGKVIADFIALRVEDGVWLDVAESAAADLEKRLKMFRLRSDVVIAPRDDLFVAITQDGTPGQFADPRHPDLPGRTISAHKPDETCEGYAEARMALGVPEQGADFASAEVFPADINMDHLNGVDLKKGCFVGQEVVSRMHRRGNIRRRTIALTGTGLVPGDTLMATSPLGEVTSVSGARALARVRIDRFARAEADGQAIHVNDNPVKIAKQDWLVSEMAASLNHD
jgi:hypothetical protein